MKDVELWSRGRDRKILIALGALYVLAFAAAIGANVLPPADRAAGIRLLQGGVCALLLLFVWCGFRLIRPRRADQRWAVAELIVVPVLWVMLSTALCFWLNYLSVEDYQEIRARMAG